MISIRRIITLTFKRYNWNLLLCVPLFILYGNKSLINAVEMEYKNFDVNNGSLIETDDITYLHVTCFSFYQFVIFYFPEKCSSLWICWSPVSTEKYLQTLSDFGNKVNWFLRYFLYFSREFCLTSKMSLKSDDEVPNGNEEFSRTDQLAQLEFNVADHTYINV